MYRMPAPRPEENRIVNPATPARAFHGELDNSVNCGPWRRAMTVLRFSSRLHRNTTDWSSTCHPASRARAAPSTKPNGTGRTANSSHQPGRNSTSTVKPAAYPSGTVR